MKKVLFIWLLSLSITSITFSQTTMMDYNYIKMGMGDDLKRGRGIKEGYRLDELKLDASVVFYMPKITRTATLYYFKKKSTGKTIAIVIECSDTKGNLMYRCVPTWDAPQEVWDKVFQDFVNDDKWSPVFAWVLVKYASSKRF